MKKTGDPVLPVGQRDLHLAAHLFNPSRLTIARELRGLTKAELADKIAKSAAAIGQFESARARPDARTLASMALVLRVPIGFLARRTSPNLMNIEQCHFRSLRAASQRHRRRLLAAGTLLCDVVGFLEERVEMPVEHVSSLATTVKAFTDIEDCAVAVRRAWGLGLGPIPNLIALLEANGIIVSTIPHDCADVDAFSAWHEGRPLVFLVDHKESTSRKRFDAAHELGHLIMHADVNAGDPELERQANRFAAAFLVPSEAFIVECPRWLNWEHFYELKRRWRVSVAALVKRAFDLGLISEASYRRAFVHLNRTGERTHERDEPARECPVLVRKALACVDDTHPIETAAEHLSVPTADLTAICENQ